MYFLEFWDGSWSWKSGSWLKKKKKKKSHDQDLHNAQWMRLSKELHKKAKFLQTKIIMIMVDGAKLDSHDSASHFK